MEKIKLPVIFIFCKKVSCKFILRKEIAILSYQKRIALLVLLDSIIVFTSIYLSYQLVYPITLENIPNVIINSSIILLCTHHVFAVIYKLYRKVWEYASINELKQIIKAVTFSILVTAAVQNLAVHDIYARTLIITWLLNLLLIGGSRFAWRLFRGVYITKKNDKVRTLVIGAGSAGAMVVRQLQKNQNTNLEVVAFVDDDKKKKNLEMYNIPVAGTTEHIQKIVNSYRIQHIIIAIPSLKRKEINSIFERCIKTKVKTEIVPMLEDILCGNVSINELRDVQVEDLLGRPPVKLDNKGISEKLMGKKVLITGAGGSIGSEICRQIMKFCPSEIILLGHGENSIYTIEMELKEFYKNSIQIITEIADIQDRNKMFDIVKKHQPYIVYHAAAHKHVPLMERNPEEAIKNNIIGTKNIAEASMTFKVNTFVMVSTDKAVNPTSVMGATKRIAEMIVQHMDSVSDTRFVTVRFGNVLGSRGSVIPLFKKQIQNGGPVTVTHRDMVRYFMTIPEASRLVIQAGALAKGGEIFVLDMGKPVKITDLAKKFINLSGYSTEEIEIHFTGIRPGEKLFEELLSVNEIYEKQIYPKIFVGKTYNQTIDRILDFLNSYEQYPSKELRVKLLNFSNNNENLFENVDSQNDMYHTTKG